MRGHASLDQLADLGAGLLRPRKAAQLTQHLTSCTQCTAANSQLTEVPYLLASTSYPDIPQDLSARITTSLAAEASQRQAGAPATEAGRRDLPGSPGRRTGGGLRFPRLSRPAVRIATAAAALAVVGAGAYAATSQLGSSGGPSASSAAGLAAGESVGPRVTYGPASSARTIQTVSSDTNFVPAKLSSQAATAVKDARLEGVHPGTARQASAAPDIHSSNNAGLAGPNLASPKLQGCVSAVAAGRAVLLVELAKFSGKGATIIVTAASGSKPAEAWVVGSQCSAAARDVLDHVRLAHI